MAEDRDRFENMMSGAFSQMETIHGPEMHENMVEQAKLSTEFQRKNLSHLDNMMETNIAYNRATAEKERAKAGVFQSITVAILMLTTVLTILTIIFGVKFIFG